VVAPNTIPCGAVVVGVEPNAKPVLEPNPVKLGWLEAPKQDDSVGCTGADDCGAPPKPAPKTEDPEDAPKLKDGAGTDVAVFADDDVGTMAPKVDAPKDGTAGVIPVAAVVATAPPKTNELAGLEAEALLEVVPAPRANDKDEFCPNGAEAALWTAKASDLGAVENIFPPNDDEDVVEDAPNAKGVMEGPTVETGFSALLLVSPPNVGKETDLMGAAGVRDPIGATGCTLDCAPEVSDGIAPNETVPEFADAFKLPKPVNFGGSTLLVTALIVAPVLEGRPNWNAGLIESPAPNSVCDTPCGAETFAAVPTEVCGLFNCEEGDTTGIAEGAAILDIPPKENPAMVLEVAVEFTEAVFIWGAETRPEPPNKVIFLVSTGEVKPTAGESVLIGWIGSALLVVVAPKLGTDELKENPAILEVAGWVETGAIMGAGWWRNPRTGDVTVFVAEGIRGEGVGVEFMVVGIWNPEMDVGATTDDILPLIVLSFEANTVLPKAPILPNAGISGCSWRETGGLMPRKLLTRSLSSCISRSIAFFSASFTSWLDATVSATWGPAGGSNNEICLRLFSFTLSCWSVRVDASRRLLKSGEQSLWLMSVLVDTSRRIFTACDEDGADCCSSRPADLLPAVRWLLWVDTLDISLPNDSGVEHLEREGVWRGESLYVLLTLLFSSSVSQFLDALREARRAASLLLCPVKDVFATVEDSIVRLESTPDAFVGPAFLTPDIPESTESSLFPTFLRFLAAAPFDDGLVNKSSRSELVLLIVSLLSSKSFRAEMTLLEEDNWCPLPTVDLELGVADLELKELRLRSRLEGGAIFTVHGLSRNDWALLGVA
jgi:hypothetical protein